MCGQNIGKFTYNKQVESRASQNSGLTEQWYHRAGPHRAVASQSSGLTEQWYHRAGPHRAGPHRAGPHRAGPHRAVASQSSGLTEQWPGTNGLNLKPKEIDGRGGLQGEGEERIPHRKRKPHTERQPAR